MEKQNYQNHKIYYTPHHYVFLPVTALLGIFGLVKACLSETNRLEWLMFAVLFFCLFCLAVMLRQHYALGNQDRIVRLEFRLRYFELMGESSQRTEEQLSFSQIAALRFASDHEFASLLNRAITENLSADEIKKAVKNWKADTMRV